MMLPQGPIPWRDPQVYWSQRNASRSKYAPKRDEGNPAWRRKQSEIPFRPERLPVSNFQEG